MKHSFGHNISAIYRNIQIWINGELSSLGFGSGQFMFFNHISRLEGITQKELSRTIAIDKATTAKAVKKLKELGYIRSVVNKDDNRVQNLYLTSKGREILPRVRVVLKETTAILQNGMEPEEMDFARKTLDKMHKNITGRVRENRLV